MRKAFPFLKIIPAVALLFSITLLNSCKKDDNGPDYKIVVFTEKVTTLSEEYIGGVLGTISVSFPEAGQLTPLVGDDVNVYRMVYKSSIEDIEYEASGLVCMPATKGAYPVLCFLNGTNTLNSDAPSNNPTSFSYQMVESVASMGFIVVIPDYPGFGASSDIMHPYLIKEPTVQSVVDMIRAAGEFTEKGIKGYEMEKDLYFYGYSQGGWAALTMHKAIETSYSTEFTLKGSACGSGAYDLGFINSEFLEHTTYPSPMYIAYIAQAYKSYGETTLPLSSMFKEPYATLIPSLFDGLHSAGQINSALTTTVANLVTANYLSNYEGVEFSGVRSALLNNSVISMEHHEAGETVPRRSRRSGIYGWDNTDV